jgi:hypothetical protein
MREEFMNALEAQEKEFQLPYNISEVMNSAWERRSYWVYCGLSSVNAMFGIFYQYIAPQFRMPTDAEENFLSQYWSTESKKAVERKLQDRENYISALKETFDSLA